MEAFVVAFFITWIVILLYILRMIRTYSHLQREINILKKVGRN
ncbi:MULTISPECIES: CcmD family protein [unclassified Methanomethylovorans]